MATATLQGFSFAGDQFTASVLYDTATLVVQSILWQNLTAQPGSVEVDGPSGFSKVYTVAPGTALTSRDVSADHVQLSSRASTDKAGNPVTIVEWPAGWSLQARWPA